MTIVSNESADIVRMLATATFPNTKHAVDLYPEALREEIDQLGAFIYNRINNGTYKSGFATTQEAYDFAQRVSVAQGGSSLLAARRPQMRLSTSLKTACVGGE
jgi:putative glutathione S-transferase